MSFRWLMLLLTLLVLLPVQGQTAFTETEWIEADFALLVPNGWDAPFASTSDDGFRQTFTLAQNFADNPAARPPGTPTITLTALPILPEEMNLSAELLRLLEALDINAAGTLPGTLLGQEALFAAGTSADGALFGMGRAVLLPEGGALFVVGRVANAQQETFSATFNTVADSIVRGGAGNVLLPEYGVLWRTERTLTDAESAFLDIGGLTRTADGTLLLVDEVVGLVQLDGENGVVLASQSFTEAVTPTDIAVSPDGTVYIADTLCGCVRGYADGVEVERFEGFAVDAPYNIALAADGTLYATDFSAADEVILRTFFAEDEGQIRFDDPLFEQPLLAADQSGRVFALSRDLTLYGSQEGVFAPFYVLDSGTDATAFAFDPNNNLLVATVNEGLLLFDNTGLLQTELSLATFGSLAGVAAAPDGTLYVADVGAEYGAVIALRLGIEGGRIGVPALRPGREVSGIFSEDDARQIWYYQASGAETITLTAIAAEDSFDLDVALRLLAPGSEELAFAADDEAGILFNPLDAQLRDVPLPRAGWYAVVVERQGGAGAYRLGLSAPISIELTEGANILNGALRETLPVQPYTFTASGGQTLTITMTAETGTLDPLLRLLDANGNIIAENDDADDLALGLNAQISEFPVPFNGRYTLEAARFEGEGEYTLEIVVE